MSQPAQSVQSTPTARWIAIEAAGGPPNQNKPSAARPAAANCSMFSMAKSAANCIPRMYGASRSGACTARSAATAASHWPRRGDRRLAASACPAITASAKHVATASDGTMHASLVSKNVRPKAPELAIASTKRSLTAAAMSATATRNGQREKNEGTTRPVEFGPATPDASTPGIRVETFRRTAT